MNRNDVVISGGILIQFLTQSTLHNDVKACKVQFLNDFHEILVPRNVTLKIGVKNRHFKSAQHPGISRHKSG